MVLSGPMLAVIFGANSQAIWFVHRYLSLNFGSFCPRGVIGICVGSI
jgi:hypothetical protein